MTNRSGTDFDDGMLIIKEGAVLEALTAPTYVLRNADAAAGYFEPWFEDEIHVGISEKGVFFRLVWDAEAKRIVPHRNAAIPANKDLFTQLLRQQLVNGTLSRHESVRTAAFRALELLDRKSPDRFRKIRAMASELGFV